MATDIVAHRVWSETEKTYDVVIFDETIFTTLTMYHATVTTWINNVHSEYGDSLTVGLDVKWSRYFDPSTRKPIGAVLLCIGRSCLIFQIHRNRSVLSSPTALIHLGQFLSDHDNTFVGVDIKTKLEMLQSDYGIGGNAHCVDLGAIAAQRLRRPELKNEVLSDLARNVLGKDALLPLVSTDWNAIMLTEEQVKYACIVAFESYEIGRILDAVNYI